MKIILWELGQNYVDVSEIFKIFGTDSFLPVSEFLSFSSIFEVMIIVSQKKLFSEAGESIQNFQLCNYVNFSACAKTLRNTTRNIAVKTYGKYN